MDSTNNWYNYLHTVRKLTPEVIQMAGLDEANGLLKIPIYGSDGRVLFSKYRKRPGDKTDTPKYQYDKGASVSLYGIDHISDNTIITEGELDALALITCGYNAVSSTGGALSFQESWAPLFTERNVTVMFDNDEAGVRGMAKVALILKDVTVRWVPPKYGKDIGDVLSEYGQETVRELMERTDNMVVLRIPELTTKRAVLDYRTQLKEQVRTMSTGSTGSAVLRAIIVELSARLAQRVRPRVTTVGTDVECARAYPIENLIEVRQHKARCPFHNERTASLHVYDDNHAFCFGACNKRYDAIDIAMQVRGIDFKEAVKQLSKTCA